MCKMVLEEQPERNKKYYVAPVLGIFEGAGAPKCPEIMGVKDNKYEQLNCKVNQQIYIGLSKQLVL